MSVKIEQAPGVEDIEFQTSVLCSLQLPDGRFLLNIQPDISSAGKYIFSPIVGELGISAWDHHHWSDLGFRFEGDQNKLRGSVPVDRAGVVFDELSQGNHREHTAHNILKKELLPHLSSHSIILGRDITPAFRTYTLEKEKPNISMNASSKLRLTEVYDVQVSEKAVNAIEQAVKKGEGLVLLSEEQVRSGQTLFTNFKGHVISGTIDPSAYQLFHSDDENDPIQIDENRFKNLVYNIGKFFAFALEGRGPGAEHRLTKTDFERLRLMTQSNLTDDLEHEIIMNRVYKFFTLKGGIATGEGLLVGSSSDIDNSLSPFHILGASLLIASVFRQLTTREAARETVDHLLGEILQDIAYTYQIEAKTLGLGNKDGSLETWAESIAKTMAEAEQSAPPLVESIPTIIGVDAGLLLGQGDLKRAFIFTATILASQLLTAFVLDTKSKRWPKFRKEAAHFLDTISRYWAVAMPAPLIAGLSATDIFAIDIGAAQMGMGFGDVEEINRGTSARDALHQMLDKLTGSLATTRLWRRHAVDILAHEQVLGGEWINGTFRYTSLTNAQILDQTKFSSGADIVPNLEVIFQNYTIGHAGDVFVDDTSASFPGGVVNEILMPSGSGLTSVLRSLGDEFTHQTGTALFRLPARDYNLHEGVERRFISYHQCNASEYRDDPFSGIDRDTVREYLLSTGMFYTDEKKGIQAYLIGGKVSGSFRSRLKVARVLFGNDRVVILDDVYNNRLIPVEEVEQERHLLEAVTEFLAKEAQKGEKIIIVGTNGIYAGYRNILKSHNALGKIYTVRNGKFVADDKQR